MDFPDTNDWYKFREKLYEELTQWTEEFQDTNNLELTWKTSHLQICKISVRIFSSESDFIYVRGKKNQPSSVVDMNFC